QPAPCHEAENHRPERGDEAERKVSAVVRDKRTLAREQVQKPLVEGITEVVVLVPVRQETGVIVPEMPGGADAYRSPVETGSGKGIEGPGQPVARQNCGQCPPSPAWRTETQHEQERVAEPDLAERVFKREVGLGPVHRAQEDTEQNQRQRS